MEESPCTPSPVATDDPDYIPSSNTSEVNVNMNIPKIVLFEMLQYIVTHI